MPSKPASPTAQAAAARVRADPRWQQVLARDPSPQPAFVYSVSTTGIFCRPSCTARRPRPEHVRFFASATDATSAGFRPCKRCRPCDPETTSAHAALIEAACRLLADPDRSPPTLPQLAKSLGLSPSHLHRSFRAATGTTPKAYANAHRRKTVRQTLQRSSTVTQAIFDAGFNAPSGFYNSTNDALGMSPSTFRKGGAGTSIRFAIRPCSLGLVLVAASDRGLCAITLGDDPDQLTRDLRRQFPKASIQAADNTFEATVSHVLRLVEEPSAVLDLPLDIRGTAFQQRVWAALRQLPAGHTATYTELAASLGAPQAVRAVARACASNILAVAVPCHRIIGKSGSLSGYRWGLDRKRRLLEKERHAAQDQISTPPLDLS